MQKMNFNWIFICGFLGFSLLLVFSCSTTKEREQQTAETVFNKALEQYKKEDWLEASQLFEVIKLQYPASQYSDDAQYYLAEINYKKEEFILAAFNYSMLRKVYPSSEYFKTSLYKNAMCYYELSPAFDRDQEYTVKAIDAFQDFQRLYPEDSLFAKSSKYIDELREKLGHRAFNTAEIYLKLLSLKSALVYLDVVIDEYPDTKYFEPAYYLKITTLVTMKKFDDANSIIDLYKKKFPNGAHITEVSTLVRQTTGN